MFTRLIDVEVQLRCDELRREADAHRLPHNFQTDQQKFQDRLLLGLGDFLISSGHRLKARCQRRPAEYTLRAVSR